MTIEEAAKHMKIGKSTIYRLAREGICPPIEWVACGVSTQRNWTQLNVGEITYVYDTVANVPVDVFANALMQSVGFGEIFDIPSSKQFGEVHLEHQMVVFAMQFDVSKFEG